MNKKLETTLKICGYSALLISGVALFVYLEIVSDVFYRKLSDQIGEVAAFFAFLATILAVALASYVVHKLCTAFTQKITNNYNSFKNENNITFSEIYNDPTVKLKDKIIFSSIYLIYYFQLPFLMCASEVSDLNKQWNDDFRFNLILALINSILLLPVALLELIKYPLVKLFSPLGLGIKSLSFLFDVSDVIGSRSGQNVHTNSFERSIVQCASKLKEEYKTQISNLGKEFNELDKEFKSYINSLTDQQKLAIQPYLKLDSYPEGKWVNWQDSKTNLTLTQAVNLVLIVAREQDLDIELLKSILLVRFEESDRKCGPGMLNRIIFALSSLNAEGNFMAQSEPQQIAELASEIIKRSLEKYTRKDIKVLQEIFNDFYSPGSEVNLSNVSDNKIKSNIFRIRKDLKEFVFKELYVKFYNDYGEHIGRGDIKHRIKELITCEIIDSIIYDVIDKVEIPPTLLKKIKAFFVHSSNTAPSTSPC